MQMGLGKRVPKARNSAVTFNIAIAVIFLLQGCPVAAQHAPSVRIISADPGAEVDVFTEVNTSGTIFVHLYSTAQTACANFWWVKWPFGGVTQLGRHCGIVRFDIPSVGKFTFASKLRAGSFSSPTKIAVSADELAIQLPDIHF